VLSGGLGRREFRRGGGGFFFCLIGTRDIATRHTNLSLSLVIDPCGFPVGIVEYGYWTAYVHRSVRAEISGKSRLKFGVSDKMGDVRGG